MVFLTSQGCSDGAYPRRLWFAASSVEGYVGNPIAAIPTTCPTSGFWKI